MDGLTLLELAKTAGLSVRAEGDRLVITGPRHAEALVREILPRKVEVLAALALPGATACPPVTPWRRPAELAGWSLEWRERFGRRANALHDAGVPMPEDERQAFAEVSAERAAIELTAQAEARGGTPPRPIPKLGLWSHKCD